MAEAAVSDLIPGGSVFAALLRHGQQRSLQIARELVDRAAEPAGYEELLARVETNEEVAAIFRQAVDAAARTGDTEKRRMLARLVSEAVLDDAKVDEATIFVSIMRDMEGPHLRALELMRRGALESIDEVNERLGRGDELSEEDVALSMVRHIHNSVGDASPTSLLPGLIREGLVATIQDKKAGVHPTNWKYVANNGTRWGDYKVSRLGHRFLAFVQENPD